MDNVDEMVDLAGLIVAKWLRNSHLGDNLG